MIVIFSQAVILYHVNSLNVNFFMRLRNTKKISHPYDKGMAARRGIKY